MNYVEYPLAGGYINRYMLTPVEAHPQRFEKAVLHGRVNEWLKKGFAIHENPCRREFVEKRRGVLPEPPGGTHEWQMYFPFGKTGVEIPGFYFVPTWLRSFAKAELYSPVEQCCTFQLETCGAAAVWLDGLLVANFAPFTRNMPKTTEFKMTLKSGSNKLTVCFEDLAERDTDYFFRLRCLEDSGLCIRLPLDDKLCPDTLTQIETMLDGINFDREVYIDEPGTLYIANPFDKALNIDIMINPSNWIATLAKQQPPDVQRHTLAPGQQSLRITPACFGYCYFHVGCEYFGITPCRVIGGQFVSGKLQGLDEAALEKRKARMIDLIAESETENVFKAAAIFHLNGDLPLAEAIVTRELEGIAAKMDCSDFHFAMVLHSYISANDRLSPALKAAIRKTMLEYRYWIDEPGDDVMWFFSENHALMFHVCQYLAGGLLPDETFKASGLDGLALRKKAERLLDEWFAGFFEEFITEWNSSMYIPIDFLGLAVLYIHGDDTLREKSRKAMDMLSRCLAACSHDGALMTTAGRVYEKELKGAFASGTTGILHMLYNTGTICKVDFSLPLAISGYEPPAEYAKDLRPQNGPLVVRAVQGFEKHVNTYLYKDAYGVLSTAVGFKPYERGYQEHIVHCALDKTAQVFVNHPGESHPYGTGRPNFWAGNGVLPLASQEGDTAVLRYSLADHRICYTHAYAPLPEFDEHIVSNNVIVLRKGRGFIGIKAKNGLELVTKGPCAMREFVSHGRENIWAVKLGNADKHGSLAKFFDSVAAIDIA